VPTEYELGLLVGLLVGEGHFGGDGRQPQITLRMHVRHQALFHWLERTFPGGRLYGPYDPSGRRYYQWMARGPYLRDELLPLIQSRITSDLDGYGHERLVQMMTRYPGQLAPRSRNDAPGRHANASDEASPREVGASSQTELGLEEGKQSSEASDAPSPQPVTAPTEPVAAQESTLSRAESIFARMRDLDDSN
jgi:hypothetical protein